jgi:hypothetical protein
MLATSQNQPELFNVQSGEEIWDARNTKIKNSALRVPQNKIAGFDKKGTFFSKKPM